MLLGSYITTKHLERSGLVGHLSHVSPVLLSAEDLCEHRSFTFTSTTVMINRPNIILTI